VSQVYPYPLISTAASEISLGC